MQPCPAPCRPVVFSVDGSTVSLGTRARLAAWLLWSHQGSSARHRMRMFWSEPNTPNACSTQMTTTMTTTTLMILLILPSIGT